MNVELAIPAELLEAITAEVTERVLAELAITSASPESPYLSVPEAAAYMRCSRARVDDLLSQGKLTRVKDGRRTLVERAEVERHLAQSTAQARR